MSDKKTSTERGFGIGAVARMTGLTDHTIRVWERRYGAVVADRAANGRRVYRSEDIEKLRLLRLLTEHGVSIGRIAGESFEALSARALEMRALSAGRAPDEPQRVAILGDRLASVLRTAPVMPVALNVVAACGHEDQLMADLRQHPGIDALLIEMPVLDEQSLATLRRLAVACDTARVVWVYNFARAADVEATRAGGVVALRSPVNADEIAQAVLQVTAVPEKPPAAKPSAGADVDDPVAADDVPPRRFTPAELAALASLSTTIDCECPRHLADLVGALSAFELYSAGCSSRNEDDARLHRYLHRTTARARALVEGALDRVAREEGLIEA